MQKKMKKVIEVKNLVKQYPKLTAVNGVTFDVYQGEIFGLLGENGAGKTTTLEMIEGLRKPTAGEIKVAGFDRYTQLDQIKHKIGVQLQSSAYYQFLTLREIVSLFCTFYGCDIDPISMLKMVDLEDKADSFINSLSGGQKQRFSIIASLVNDPEIVFLDEPTTGLDPIARRNLWELITKIKSNGKTVVLTTHYMEEAEILCDRVAIMDKGIILALDETHRLVEKVDYPLSVNFIDGKIDKAELEKLKKVGKLTQTLGKEKHFNLRLQKQDDLNFALSIIIKFKPESLLVGRATLEDVFVELTGKKIEE